MYIPFLLPSCPFSYLLQELLHSSGRQGFSHGTNMEEWCELLVLLYNYLFLSASGIALFKVFVIFPLGHELWVSKSVVTKQAFSWQKPSSQWVFLNTC